MTSAAIDLNDLMVKRLTVTIDDDIYKELEVWADEEVRSVANTIAAIVTNTVRERIRQRGQKAQNKKD